MIQITNDTGTVKVTIDGVSQSIGKVGVSLTIAGNILYVREINGRLIRIDHSRVDNPVTATVEALRVAIENFLE